jgi:hypothetical protein
MELLFLLVFTINEKIITVKTCVTAPKIDGVIEQIWLRADSAYGFIQFMPYEGKEASDSTVVYLLQDKDNLYIAFRCYTTKRRPVARLGGSEEGVNFYLNPFGNKTTAYYFKVTASGNFDDGMLLDDGRNQDDAWDGVWYHAAKCYGNRYDVEMKIPFKSIRYKSNLPEWGINFGRFIITNRERDYWTATTQIEGLRVSRFGILKGINPKSHGYYFELFPECFFRYNKYAGEAGKFRPSGSLNFKWDLTSQTTLTSTINPDFAQIEADPYTLNLSRYPVYLNERRPFFLEGQEIFRMSDFGQTGFYQPLEIYYSRRIGKSLDGKAVPILGGLKLTNKAELWNIGLFGAFTDSLETEPGEYFGVTRIKRKILENSEVGILASGVIANPREYNYAVGLDGVYRTGPNQFIVQGAISDKNEKIGWAGSSGFMGFIKNFLAIGSFEIVSDSFDVSEIGYVPWFGLKKLVVTGGPFKTYPTGYVRNLFFGPGLMAFRSPRDSDWSKFFSFTVNPNFRNNWGGNFELSAGPSYEAGLHYLQRGENFSIWGNGEKYNIILTCSYHYYYNYNRAYPAYQSANYLSFSYNPIARLTISLASYLWLEWDTLNSIVGITPMVTPRIDFTLSKEMSIGIYSEFVMSTQGENIKETNLLSNRVGFLFSYNFSPKSWIYIALNDYRVDRGTGLAPAERIGAIKVKYLLYF